MYQYYIIEIQKNQNQQFSHDVFFAFDTDSTVALQKAESKYYERLSQAAVSNNPLHSVCLLSCYGKPLHYQAYEH